MRSTLMGPVFSFGVSGGWMTTPVCCGSTLGWTADHADQMAAWGSWSAWSAVMANGVLRTGVLGEGEADVPSEPSRGLVAGTLDTDAGQTGAQVAAKHLLGAVVL